ncbi:hypothetical protein RND71_010591 [Anisodus tanguticus]|uniref:P-type ATPase C-terminal domain-containing protein n=1 Tax=Anisodus tanguticus TaxID=243964 RepID=A0AAE1SK30_9SOLA|nr:hypothetical protein RND71_010591 [Anisodus tanguticus]
MLAFSAWALVLPKDLLNDMLLLLQKRCIWFYSLLYETYASFSAQLAYNDWFLSLYNVFFTSLPVIALGVFDQDVSARYCLKVYRTSFSAGSRIIRWMLNGVCSAVIIFFICITALDPQSFNKDGKIGDYSIVGTTMYTCGLGCELPNGPCC